MKHVLLSFVALAFAAAAFAAPSKEDPIIIQHSKLDAKRLQPGAVPSSSGQWTRIEIPLFAKENPDNKLNVARVEIKHPSPFLANNLTLVDTPGVGSLHENNTKCTNNHLLFPAHSNAFLSRK